MYSITHSNAATDHMHMRLMSSPCICMFAMRRGSGAILRLRKGAWHERPSWLQQMTTWPPVSLRRLSSGNESPRGILYNARANMLPIKRNQGGMRLRTCMECPWVAGQNPDLLPFLLMAHGEAVMVT